MGVGPHGGGGAGVMDDDQTSDWRKQEVGWGFGSIQFEFVAWSNLEYPPQDRWRSVAKLRPKTRMHSVD